MSSETIIDSNIQYELSETAGRLGREIKITPKSGWSPLTPFGAAALARQLMRWAVYQDKELAERYPSFRNTNY